jgi:copper chaperone CopZ
MRQQATLESLEISCEHCIQSIQKVVEKLPGVKFLGGEPDKQQVSVEYDPDEASLDLIAAAMEVEGYPVKN